MGHLLQVSLSCHNQNREKVTTILGISTIPHRAAVAVGVEYIEGDRGPSVDT